MFPLLPITINKERYWFEAIEVVQTRNFILGKPQPWRNQYVITKRKMS